MNKKTRVERFLEAIGDFSGEPTFKGTGNWGKGSNKQLANGELSKPTKIIADQTEEETQAELPGIPASQDSIDAGGAAPNGSSKSDGYVVPTNPSYVTDNAKQKYISGREKNYMKGDGYTGMASESRKLNERNHADALYSTLPGAPRNNSLSKQHRFLQPNSPEDLTSDNKPIPLIPGLEKGRDPTMLANWSDNEQVIPHNRMEGDFKQLVKPVDWMDEFEIDNQTSDLFGDYAATKEMIPGKGRQKEKVINKPDGSSETASGKQLTGPLNNTGWGYAGKLEKQHKYIEESIQKEIDEFAGYYDELHSKIKQEVKGMTDARYLRVHAPYLSDRALTNFLNRQQTYNFFSFTLEIPGYNSSFQIYFMCKIDDSRIMLQTVIQTFGAISQKNKDDMFDKLDENEEKLQKLQDFCSGFLSGFIDQKHYIELDPKDLKGVANFIISTSYDYINEMKNAINEYELINNTSKQTIKLDEMLFPKPGRITSFLFEERIPMNELFSIMNETLSYTQLEWKEANRFAQYDNATLTMFFSSSVLPNLILNIVKQNQTMLFVLYEKTKKGTNRLAESSFEFPHDIDRISVREMIAKLYMNVVNETIKQLSQKLDNGDYKESDYSYMINILGQEKVTIY